MFFGLILKANRKYTQTIKKAFHLSQAALDITSCGDDPVQLILTSEKTSYILCTLKKDSVLQVPLDLNFAEGDEISFQSQGNGSIHLSGYLVDEDYLGDDEELDLAEALKETASKKQKKDKKNAKSSDDEDEDDDDDEDGDADMGDSDEDGEGEEDDDEDGGEEEDDDDDDDDEDDDDEEDESDADSEDVKEPAPKKGKIETPKQNGIEKPSKKDKKNKDKQQQQQQQQQQKPTGGEKTLQGGVKITDLRVGNGPEAKAGKKVSVYYEGRLKSNNKMFDSAKQGNGFKFALGNGDVIKGWDVGVVGMKVGGKRRITCPPNAAYGAKGSPPVIPPNSTLVFEVELKAVH